MSANYYQLHPKYSHDIGLHMEVSELEKLAYLEHITGHDLDPRLVEETFNTLRRMDAYSEELEAVLDDDLCVDLRPLKAGVVEGIAKGLSRVMEEDGYLTHQELLERFIQPAIDKAFEEFCK